MRNLDTNHWENLETLEGLLFFSQLVDEMLFDYTLDSYKPLALNSRLLCIECLDTIDEVTNGNITVRNLQSVLEELKWSLENDVAAQALLGIKYKNYIDQIKPNDIKLKETGTIIRFLYNSFDEKKYLHQITKSIEALIQDGKNKEKIKSLTSAFLTELVNYGYNPTYIFFQNSTLFFNTSRKSKIESVQIINEFFKIFDFEKTEFTVVLMGGIIFRNFQGTLKDFDIVVSKNYKCFSKMIEDVNFEKSRKVNESFIICSRVQALDHHSARQHAETLIGKISSVFNFYHHKVRPEILDKAVICRNKDNFVVISDKPLRSILKPNHDQNPQDAALSVEKTLTKLSFDRESTYRFARSIDLHGAAISATALENQLLDLWAALETLIPKSMESNKDRIVQICDNLVPFLQLNYIEKQLLDIAKDLKFWNLNKFDKILNEIPGADKMSELEKIANLISLKANVSYRTALYSELKKFPLLKNRIYTLHESMNSAAALKKTLERHSTKANWHIRRIYRTRGLIIHSGKYPSYTAILIEHLHNYLDLFLKKLIDLSIVNRISSIDQGLLEIRMTIEYKSSLLKKHKDEEITLDNINEVLLGKE